jgi:hypothetical protein
MCVHVRVVVVVVDQAHWGPRWNMEVKIRDVPAFAKLKP